MMPHEPDAIDRLLKVKNTDDEIVPSSGFTQAVMAAVRQTADTPPPIPFPWIRASPWFAGVGITLGAVGYGMWQMSITPAPVAPLVISPQIQAVVNAATEPGNLWAATAVLVSLATTVAGLRLGAWLERR